MSVYGKCELKSKQATAEIYDISNQKILLKIGLLKNGV